MANLPPEVWNKVLEDVSQLQLPPLLGVCSLFHDIIIRLLFSSIKIYFIDGELAYAMLNTFHKEWADETGRKLMCKSWEILNHVCQEPRFARVIKSVTVVAYSNSLAIFERLTVANALLYMPNLQTFRWMGNGPPFDSVVSDCLPVNLKKLVVQSSFPLSSLRRLEKLTSLHLPIPFYYPDDEEAHDTLVFDPTIPDLNEFSVADIAQAMSAELQSLRVTSLQVHGIPIRMLNMLTELEIVATIGDQEELMGLDLVFHHASSLESLTLVGLLSPDVFSLLPQSSTSSLPRLNSFRFSSDHESEYASDMEFQALLSFVENRSMLRRLYIRFPDIYRSQALTALSVIRNLEHLEVLGLHLGKDVIGDTETVGMLGQSLSAKLRALHITMNWTGGTILPLVDAIARLPDLTFLHLYGAIVRLPVLLEDLAVECKGLQMIGLNRALWMIDRVGTDIITSKYPRWRIKFGVDEDFLCADDAWLFKYN